MIEIIKAFILLLLSLFIVNTTAAEDQPQYAKTDPSQSFKFKEKYPPPLKIPKAKPEWLELIRHVNITSAPVYKNINYAGPQPLEAGKDPYCDWTFTGCLGKDDLYQCPKGQWAVTYDDGPSEFSPKLYDVLDAANIKATFFMVGGQVVKFPDYVLRAYKAGHEIAMHTWTHSYMTTLTNEQIVAELKWNELAIKEVIGVSPRYFRPPYGDIDNRVRDVAAALGFTAIIWNHDTFDWAFASNPKAFNERWIDGNVTEWAKIAKTADVGGISLEHDLYNQTVDAAIRVLPILQKEYTLLPAAACNHQSQLVYKEVTSHKKANEEEKKKDKTPSTNKGAEPAVTSSKEVPSTSNAVPHIHAVGTSSGLFLLVASLFVFYM
jgi:peptidoglycan/xylan/chitin deacetylase (PgdA/CDA1 family)